MTAHQHDSHPGHLRALLACAAIIAGTVAELAGTDLVLPSIPALPDIFGTTITNAQFVLSAYAGGTALGLLGYGALSAHVGRRKLFIASLALTALAFAVAPYVTDIWQLVALRFLQGAFASGAAVIAPGLIRALFSEHGSIRAISAMGSIESLVPALAPIAGAWLHAAYGWTASFHTIALFAVGIGAIMLLVPGLLPSIGTHSAGRAGRYIHLIKNPTYLRYALSHALVLGGLLTFVFSAPAVIIRTMGGTITHFITMQIVGIGIFIVVANMAGAFVKRFGAERVILFGTYMAVIGAAGPLLYGLFGPNNPAHLPYLFWVLNTGLGLRGGAGFVRALMAARGDDERASALLILAIMAVAALGSAAVAPFVDQGITTLGLVTLLIVAPALLLMIAIKPLADGEQSADH